MRWTDRIGRRLKPRDLHIFMTVIEQLSMANAAEALAVSRPVVSKAIADLEHMLGVPLLDRGPQGVEPTRFGTALFKRSAVVFDELNQSVREIEFLADPTAGEVHFGCTETLTTGLVPAVIDQLRRRYPRLTFRLELGTAPMLVSHYLRERKCELVIARPWAPTTEPDLDVETLFQEEVCIVAGPRNKWRQRKVRLEAIVNEPWILSPVDLQPDAPFVRAFREVGANIPRPTILSGSVNLRNSFLASGPYLTTMPASSLQFGPAGRFFKVLPLKLPHWQFPVSIITLKNRSLSPIAHLFVTAIREVTKPLAKAQPRGRQRILGAGSQKAAPSRTQSR